MAIEITSLAVKVDPTGAEQGAQRATQAADRMAKEMVGDLKQVEAESKKAGSDVKHAGDDMARAGKKVENQFDRLGSTGAFGNLARNFRGGLGGLASMAIDAADALGLLNNGFGQMVRRAESVGRVATRAGEGFAAVGAGGAVAAGGIAAMMAALAPLLPIIIAVAAAIGVLVLAFKALGAAWDFVATGFPIAAQIEDATVSMSILMGSMEAARERIAEIQRFAAVTPFESPELIEASRTLQVFTDGALAGAEGLTLIGDAAAGVNKPIGEVAMWVGRLYAGLKGGQPIGEATMRLLEMGALTPQLKGKLDALAASANEGGKNFASIWALAEQSLERYAGTMDKRSRTWNGLISSLTDNWNMMKVAIAAPIQESLKPLLADLVKWTADMVPKFKEWGIQIGNFIKAVSQLFKTGGVGEAVDAWVEGMANKLGQNLKLGAADFMVYMIENVTKPVVVFAAGIHAAAVDFINYLLEGFDKVIAKMDAINPLKKVGIAQGLIDAGAEMFFPRANDATPWTVGANGPGTGIPGRLDKPQTDQISSDISAMTQASIEAITMVRRDIELEKPTAKLDAVMNAALRDWERQYGTHNETLARTNTAVGNAADAATDLAANMADAASAAGQASTSLASGGTWGPGGDPYAVNERGNMYGGSVSITWEEIARRGYDLTGKSTFELAQTNPAFQAYLESQRRATESTLEYAMAQERATQQLFALYWADKMRWKDTDQKTKGQYTSYVTPSYYHSGNYVATGERPAVLEAGETVLTQEQTASIRDRLRGSGGAGGGTPITIINVTSREEILQAVAQNPSAILNVLSRNAPAVRGIIAGK